MLTPKIWSPRLKKEKLRALYVDHANGMVDPELVADVALTLYMRCRDILAMQVFQKQKLIRCPDCYLSEGTEVWLPSPPWGDERPIVCPECGLSFTLSEFQASYRNRQLNPGGAVPAFRRYVEQYERGLAGEAAMQAIDALIHEFHYSLPRSPDHPTRSAACNLLEGKMGDITDFLDELTYSVEDVGMKARAQKWRELENSRSANRN